MLEECTYDMLSDSLAERAFLKLASDNSAPPRRAALPVGSGQQKVSKLREVHRGTLTADTLFTCTS
jgi:hypothetical protein